MAALVGTPVPELAALAPAWNDLPRDEYLRDGGRYRSRRHACFVQDRERRHADAHAAPAHWQPTTYNALHGGLERWFAPIEPPLPMRRPGDACWAVAATLFASVREILDLVHRGAPVPHRHRARGIGRPTPEGAHRDGVDFIAIVLVARESGHRWRDAGLPARAPIRVCASRSRSRGRPCCSTIRASCTRPRRSSRRRRTSAGATRS